MSDPFSSDVNLTWLGAAGKGRSGCTIGTRRRGAANGNCLKYGRARSVFSKLDFAGPHDVILSDTTYHVVDVLHQPDTPAVEAELSDHVSCMLYSCSGTDMPDNAFAIHNHLHVPPEAAVSDLDLHVPRTYK